MNLKDPAALAAFLDKIKSTDNDTRIGAWQSAGPMGASAIAPLAEIAAGTEKGPAKAATEAMQSIAHYSARHGSGPETHAVSAALLKVGASAKPRLVRSNAINLIGFTGDSTAIPGLMKLLADMEMREDARMALERIPGAASLNALKKAYAAGPADFKDNIQQSLHNRGLTPKTAGLLATR